MCINIHNNTEHDNIEKSGTKWQRKSKKVMIKVDQYRVLYFNFLYTKMHN